MGSLGPRCPLPFRARRPERSVLWRAHGSGQNLTRLVRDKYLPDISPDPHLRSLPFIRESFPTAHYDQLVPFLLNITGRSIALGHSKVIQRKLFVAVCHSSRHHIFFHHVIHRLFIAVRARSEVCAPRAFSLAKLDRFDCHGAFRRRRVYRACIRLS
jgi:hypothetical protein